MSNIKILFSGEELGQSPTNLPELRILLVLHDVQEAAVLVTAVDTELLIPHHSLGGGLAASHFTPVLDSAPQVVQGVSVLVVIGLLLL